MIDNYRFLHSINSKVCDIKPSADFLSNPNNILILSVNHEVTEKIFQSIHHYQIVLNDSDLAFPGTLQDRDQQFPLYSEVLSKGKCKIFILQNKLFELKYLFEAIDIAGKSFNVQLFHNSLSYCNATFSDFNPRCLENMVNIGISATQSHLSGEKMLSGQHFDSYRLGQLLNNMEVINDAISYADVVVADLSALKQCDIPGRNDIASSGLSSEAFNHIARNAGLSRAQITVLTGLENLNSEDCIGIDTLAQFIYYYLDGARIQGRQNSEGNLISYTIDECLPYESVKFLKNDFSGSWFAEFPTRLPDHLAHLQLVPCSYQDYQLSGRGELSPRILDVFKTLDDIVN